MEQTHVPQQAHCYPPISAVSSALLQLLPQYSFISLSTMSLLSGITSHCKPFLIRISVPNPTRRKFLLKERLCLTEFWREGGIKIQLACASLMCYLLSMWCCSCFCSKEICSCGKNFFLCVILQFSPTHSAGSPSHHAAIAS